MNKYAPIIEKLQGRYYSDFELGELLVKPKLGEAHLDEIESQLGHLLPDDYREFLLDYAGIVFEDDPFFPLNKDGVMRDASISGFYDSRDERTLADSYFDGRVNFGYIGSECYPGLHLIRDVPSTLTRMDWPAELLPIGYDAGGNEICLALFGLRPSAIFQWMNAPGNGQNLYLVADSFDEFMHSLYKEE